MEKKFILIVLTASFTVGSSFAAAAARAGRAALRALRGVPGARPFSQTGPAARPIHFGDPKNPDHKGVIDFPSGEEISIGIANREAAEKAARLAEKKRIAEAQPMPEWMVRRKMRYFVERDLHEQAVERERRARKLNRLRNLMSGEPAEVPEFPEYRETYGEVLARERGHTLLPNFMDRLGMEGEIRAEIKAENAAKAAENTAEEGYLRRLWNSLKN